MSKLKGNSTLLIGIGNSFRGDDAVGPVIIRESRKHFQEIDTLILEDDIIAVLDHWKERKVIMVDTVRHPELPEGEIMIYEGIDHIILNQEVLTSSHSINLFEALELGKVLDNLPKDITLIGVSGKSFTIGEGMSEGVQKILGKVVDLISQKIS